MMLGADGAIARAPTADVSKAPSETFSQ